MFDRKAYCRTYYLAHKEELREYYKKNKAKIIAYQHEYNRTHKEKRRAYNTAYRIAHKEEFNKYQKEYKKKTREKNNKYARERRAAIKAGTWVFMCNRKAERMQEPSQKLTKAEKLREHQYEKDKKKIETIKVRWGYT